MVESIQGRISSSWEQNKSCLGRCLVFTFIWGMIAHGYFFLNNSISHDSLNEFMATQSIKEWKYSLGRVFVPPYEMWFRGEITLTWLIGLLSLLYIGCSVFLIVKAFKIESGLFQCLLAGFCTVNITVIAVTATYIHDLDCDLLALLLSVLSFYLWNRTQRGFLLGVLPLAISIGLYQSYISVTITLVLFTCILDLMNGQETKKVFCRGCKAIAMLLMAGVLYFILLKLICYMTAVPLQAGEYNTMGKMQYYSLRSILGTTYSVWRYTIKHLVEVETAFSPRFSEILHLVLFGFRSIVILQQVFSKKSKMDILGRLTVLGLFFLIPLGMNVSRVITMGVSHDLMYYAMWLMYLFDLLLARFCFQRIGLTKPIKNSVHLAVVPALIAVILFGNIRLANMAYLYKDFSKDAHLSYFSRVSAKMETYDGYVPGETEVAFLGNPSWFFKIPDEYAPVQELTGLDMLYLLGSAELSYYQSYFDNVLMNHVNIVSEEVFSEVIENPAVEEMPYYPAEDSIRMIDGVLVVKLG